MAQDINIRVGADISDLEKNLNKAQKALQRSGQQMSRIGNDMIMSLSVPILALGGSALKAAGNFEAMANGLTAIMGDADAAAKELELLKEAAKNPGLGLNQAVTGSVRLQSIGLSAELARTNMLAMGNAIALVGGGAAELDRATLAMQQIGAKGKVSAEEINQLNEVIPQIRAVMKETFGTADTEQIQKMGIDANTFIEGITSGLQKLPQATGGIKNAIENAGIAMSSTLASLGMSLNEAFDITGRVDSFSASLASAAEWFGGLDNGVKRVIFSIAGLVVAIGPAIKMVGMFQLVQASLAGNMATVVGVFTRLRAAVASFTTVQAALNAVMVANPIGVVVVAVAALAAAMYVLYQNSEVVRNAMDNLFNNVLKPAFEFLVSVGKIIIDVFVSIAQSVMNTGRAVWDMFATMQQAVINFIDKIPFVGKAVKWMQEAFRVAVAFIQKLFTNLPAVFAGLSAEAKETGEDLKRYFEKIALTAQIIAKKVQLAMTLDGDARAALQKSINKLAEQKSALSKEGKAFGVAFKEAYNAEIAKMKAPTVTTTKTSTSAPAVSGGSVVGGDFAAAAAAQKSLGDATKVTTKEIETQNEELAVAAVALNELQTAQLKMPESAAIMQQSFTSMEQGVQKMRISTEQLKTVMMDFNSGLTSALQQGAVDMAVGIGEMVGSMAAGSSNMADLGAMLLGTLGGVLGQVGQLAISTGVAMLGIKAALESLNPALAIAGGIALVALAGLVKSKAGSLGEKFGKGGKTPAFANGGLVDKPTYGVFGEAGPEVIIPKKKLDSYLNNMNGSGNGGGSLSARISGNDLLILLDKAKVRNGRV